jgi:hypothetical protein
VTPNSLTIPIIQKSTMNESHNEIAGSPRHSFGPELDILAPGGLSSMQPGDFNSAGNNTNAIDPNTYKPTKKEKAAKQSVLKEKEKEGQEEQLRKEAPGYVEAEGPTPVAWRSVGDILVYPSTMKNSSSLEHMLRCLPTQQCRVTYRDSNPSRCGFPDPIPEGAPVKLYGNCRAKGCHHPNCYNSETEEDTKSTNRSSKSS